jgi:hypothetical protein
MEKYIFENLSKILTIKKANHKSFLNKMHAPKVSPKREFAPTPGPTPDPTSKYLPIPDTNLI